MPKDKQLNGVEDRDTNQLLVFKEVPDSLLELRRLITQPENHDLFMAGIRETTFEGSLATIAEKLGIVLDGTYNVGPLCLVIVQAIRNRSLGTGLRFQGISELVPAEIQETLTDIKLVKLTEFPFNFSSSVKTTSTAELPVSLENPPGQDFSDPTPTQKKVVPQEQQ